MTNLLFKSPNSRVKAYWHALAQRMENSKATPGGSGLSLALLSVPVSMILGWLAVVIAGDGRLDALGNPVGSDYAMFHIAGETAAAGQWSRLYDEPAQQRRLLEHFPELPSDTYLPYRYPPLVAMIFAPLAGLPYPVAFMLFTFLSVGAWLVSWWLLVETFFKSAHQRT